MLKSSTSRSSRTRKNFFGSPWFNSSAKKTEVAIRRARGTLKNFCPARIVTVSVKSLHEREYSSSADYKSGALLPGNSSHSVSLLCSG